MRSTAVYNNPHGYDGRYIRGIVSRLPIPGSDDDSWGDILNDFLSVEHNANGTLKVGSGGTLSNYPTDSTVVHLSGTETLNGIKTFSTSPVVPTPTTSNQAANKSYVDALASSGAPDASPTTNGLVRLAGDLNGTGTTATAPVISNGAITTAKLASSAVTANEIASGTITDANISASAAIAESKISGLTADLAGKLSTTNNLSDLTNATTARTNLGLGGSATLNVGTGASTVAAGNDARITGAVQSSIIQAKGDLLAGTAANAPTNLAVGADTFVLTADSSQATGMKWAASTNAVTSVFTRTGAVTAQTGDYTFSQVGAAQGITPTSSIKTSGTYAAVSGDFVLVDTSSATVAITLPTGASNDKGRISVKLVATTGSFNATVQTTGSDVFNTTGGPTQEVLSLTNQAIVLQYSSTAGIWYVLDNDLPLSQLDARYPKMSGSSFAAAAAPKVVALTDAATITVDASLGNHYVVTLGGNRTLGAPTNPTNGQRILFEVIQDSTGARTLSFNAAYAFSTGVPTPTLTTTANKRDFIGFVYNSTTALWYCLAFVNGF